MIGMTRDRDALRKQAKRLIAEIGPVFDQAVLEATRAIYVPHVDLSLPEGGERRLDLAYGDDPRQTLDLYLSAPGRRGPLLIYVPGGGFVAGDKAAYRNLGCYFARNGVTTAVINYRLAPHHPWPAGSQDVARSVDWVVAELGRAGVSVGPVVLFGQSAGATHAAGYLSGHGDDGQGSAVVSAAVLMNGIYEMTPAHQNLPNFAAYFGSDPALYRQRSPLYAVSTSRTPLSLFVAEFDPPMLATPTLDLASEVCLRDGKCPPLTWMAGHNHVSPIFAIGTPADDVGPAILDIMADVRRDAS
jgi:acetyl esterase/lipase